MAQYDWATAAAPTQSVLAGERRAAWLARVGLPADTFAAAADAAQLARLVCAHSRAVAFETFDVTLRAAVRLEPEGLAAKLLRLDRRRGGFCLETNFLLASALRAAGFAVALRHARVWMRADAYSPREPPMPRQHVVLVVRAGAGAGADEWLVDVGFGGGGPADPLPLRAGGAPVRAAGDLFRMERGDAAAGEDSWLLWAVQAGAWRRLYSFEHVNMDCPRVHAVDFILCSFFVQHAPGTLFRTLCFASLPTERGRVTLLGHELRRKGEERLGQAADIVVTPLGDAAALRAAAAEHLHIDLSELQAQTIFDATSEA